MHKQRHFGSGSKGCKRGGGVHSAALLFTTCWGWDGTKELFETCCATFAGNAAGTAATATPDKELDERCEPDELEEVEEPKELDELDDASRELAEAELADKIFNPKILRIVSHKREFGVTTLHAQTDRGRVEFQFHGRDDIRILSPTRALFRDVDGNTLELPDITQLDPLSRKFISRYF